MSFCGREGEGSYRYDMTLPFEQEEWTYATNGAVCVRVRPASGDRRESEHNAPPAKMLRWDHDALRNWQTLPRVEPLARMDTLCPRCNGYGWLGKVMTCTECDGEGYDVADCYGRYPRCSKCRGSGASGETICPDCAGNPHGTFADVVRVGDAYLGINNYRRLMDIGDVEYTFQYENLYSNPSIGRVPVMRFRFAEGAGLLMPIDSRIVERNLVQT